MAYRMIALMIALVIAALAGPAAAAQPNGDSKAAWDARLGQLAKPAPDEIVFTAVGDAIWNRPISASKDQRLQSLFDVLRGGDIAFANFEQVLADSGYPTIKEISRADPSILSEFAWAGINLVSIANNHMMDFAASGLQTTLKSLTTAGISHSGAGLTMADAIQPAIIEKKGLKVALISLLVSPQFPGIGTAATDTSPGVAPIHGARVRMIGGKAAFAPSDEDLQRLEAAIKAVRAKADVVAVSMHIHWGGLEEIDPEGKQLVTRAAIDAGADMVLGHGPHVVNGIEFYKGKPIFYSVGNFVFQFDPAAYTFFPATQTVIKNLQANPALYETMMARLILSPKGQLRRVELLPVGLTKDGDPHLTTGPDADRVMARVQNMSAAFGTKVSRSGWYAVVDIPAAQP